MEDSYYSDLRAVSCIAHLISHCHNSVMGKKSRSLTLLEILIQPLLLIVESGCSKDNVPSALIITIIRSSCKIRCQRSLSPAFPLIKLASSETPQPTIRSLCLMPLIKGKKNLCFKACISSCKVQCDWFNMQNKKLKNRNCDFWPKDNNIKPLKY